MADEIAGTCSSLLVQGVFQYAVERGLDRQELFRRSGLTTETLHDPDHRMLSSEVRELDDFVLQHLPESSLPIEAVRRTRLEGYHLFGFAIMSATTAREAILRANRYFGILSDYASYRLCEEDGEAFVELESASYPVGRGERVDAEIGVAGYFAGLQQFLGSNVPALRVCFRHAAPPDISAHREFFGVPLQFEQPRAGFGFSARVLETVPRLANPAISTYIATMAEAKLAEVQGTGADADPSKWVRDTVTRSLSSGVPSIETVARHGGVSERTLRRMLADQGLQFRQMVEDIRRDRAASLLKDARHSITEVAFSVGFSEVSAFSRAFKRWMGATPRDFRAEVTR